MHTDASLFRYQFGQYLLDGPMLTESPARSQAVLLGDEPEPLSEAIAWQPALLIMREAQLRSLGA